MKRPFLYFISGMFMGIATIVGCASTPIFPWPYFAAHLPDRVVTQADVGHKLSDLCYDEGLLYGKLGKDGWPDQALSECKPDSPSPSPSPSVQPIELKCMTVKVDDFYAIKADDEKCHSDLDKCQAGPPPIGGMIQQEVKSHE